MTLNNQKIILLLFLGIFPVLLREKFDASSLALGMFSYLLLFFILNLKFIINTKIISQKELFFIFLFFSHVIYTFRSTLNEKSLLSFFIILFVILVAKSFSKLILSKSFFNKDLFSTVFYVLIFLAVLSYFSDYFLTKLIYERWKGIFPFGEPSNFALFFGPFFLLYLFQLPSIFKQLMVVLGAAVLAVLIESTTLLIYPALALLLFVRPNFIGLFLVVPVALFGAYFVVNHPYFSSRFILSTDSVNLTALVYLQGLTDAYNALLNTNGFGLGFQMLGTQPPSEIVYQIQAVMGQDSDGGGLNRMDGGFVAAKLVAEFGVVGLILLLSYLILFFKVFLKLRKFIRNPTSFDPAYIFALVFIYGAFVEIFVRGTGYFSPSLFLFFTSLFVYYSYRKRVKYFAPYHC